VNGFPAADTEQQSTVHAKLLSVIGSIREAQSSISNGTIRINGQLPVLLVQKQKAVQGSE
jgi:hypothetical protein